MARERLEHRWLTTPSAAMPVQFSATSNRGAQVRAIATPITMANLFESILMSFWIALLTRGDSVVPFLERDREWDGNIVSGPETFITAIGAGTTYPDYKPAPVHHLLRSGTGVDMVTVVTEGIFSYCGVKVKIDTDRHLGPECKSGARER